MYICFWSCTGLLILPLRIVLLAAAARQFVFSVVRFFSPVGLLVWGASLVLVRFSSDRSLFLARLSWGGGGGE